VLPDKVVERSPIAKRLSATFFCGGIGSSDVCKGHTVFQFRSCQKLVDEPGGETISGTNIVHRLHASHKRQQQQDEPDGNTISTATADRHGSLLSFFQN
jgi:hypothetical protein